MAIDHVLGVADRRKRAILACVTATGLVAIGLGLGLTTATAGTATVSVQGNKEFTDTGIFLTAGEAVTIEASGKINVCGGPSACNVGPVGAKFTSKNCGKDAYTETFKEPGLNCWAMVFKVGSSGVPFPTGTKLTFTSPVSGELFLGPNDGNYADNSGAWSANVTTPSSFTITEGQRLHGEAAFKSTELTAKVGEIVEYLAIVTNTGSTSIKFSKLSDAHCEDISPTGEIDYPPGDEQAYSCHHTLSTAGKYTNEASITGDGETKTSNQVIVNAK